MFGDRSQCLENTGACWLNSPAQIKVVDFGEWPLKQVLVSALMLHIVSLIKHGRHSARCLVARLVV